MNIRENLEKAYEAGRAAGILEMANRDHILAALIPGPTIEVGKTYQVLPNTLQQVLPNTLQTHTRAAKSPYPNPPSTVSRGVKKAPMTRTKGVKEAITQYLIDAYPRGASTVQEIVNALGFKQTSVRATLMTMKKGGYATQEGKLWLMTRYVPAAGNGPADGNTRVAQSND